MIAILIQLLLTSLLEISGSVDNAAGMASLLSPLNDVQQRKALTWGLGGAFIIRGVTLLGAQVLISSVWVQAIAGAYLLYVMSANLQITELVRRASASGDEPTQGGKSPQKPLDRNGLLKVIGSLELLNFTMSIDQISAIVAISNNLWVLLSASLIGMLTIRLAMNWVVPIFERRAYLSNWAFLLVGCVGVQMLIKAFLHIDLGEIYDIVSITAIVVCGLIYEEVLRHWGEEHWWIGLMRWLGRLLKRSSDRIERVTVVAVRFVRSSTSTPNRHRMQWHARRLTVGLVLLVASSLGLLLRGVPSVTIVLIGLALTGIMVLAERGRRK